MTFRLLHSLSVVSPSVVWGPALLCLALAAPAAAQDRIAESVAETLTSARKAGWTPAEVARLAQVIEFAKSAHHGQLRNGGKPAILHPLRVSRAILTSSPQASRVAVEAAILHDVVEDTKVRIDAIRRAFGPRTARIVQWVTLDPVERFRGDKEARDKAYYERFKNAPRPAQVLKFYDRSDNIRDMKGFALEGKLGYLQSTQEKVVESLRAKSPDLAQRLERNVSELRAKFQVELARQTGILDRYRRADKTLRWKAVIRDRVLIEEGTGLARFTLALFLKELALVVQTGDKLRIEEFFEGLATTDFFVHYGLFAAGARAGELAYSRYLQAHVRPGFVSGLLKSNLALAAGLALPQLATGTFSGERFAISLTALGLASTAVRAQISALRWVGARSSRLTKLGLTWRRATKLGSFVYSVAETTVVLIAADVIDRKLTAWKDGRAARAALGEAGVALVEAFAANPSREDASAAAETYAEAWDDYRAWLLTPLQEDEARLFSRMAKIGERAKVLDDEHEASLARLERTPALKARLLARHGSLKAWAAAREAKERAELAADSQATLEAHQRGVSETLDELYSAPRREGGLLRDLDPGELRWLRAGLGAAHDPYAGRSDSLAKFGRQRARRTVAAALGNAGRNRPQTYQDQAAVLDLAAALLRPEDRVALDEIRAALRRQAELDARLGSSSGLSGALRQR